VGDRASLQAYVEEHRSKVFGLLGADCDATRHAAVFALSIAPSVDNVEPLIMLLADQRDFFDHDFAYASLGSLGALAFPALSRIAEESGERAIQAVQALGQSKGKALPILERLSMRDPPVPGFYSAVYNQHDPEALRWMRRGLDSPDAETRSDALFTASCLLEMAREQDSSILQELDCRDWGERLVHLSCDDEADDTEVALSALGFLRAEEHVDVVIEALAVEDSREDAIKALGWMGGRVASEALAKLLDAELEDACLAAVAIHRAHVTDEAILARSRQTMLRGIIELDGNFAWCDAAQLLRSHAAGRKVILDFMPTAGPEGQSQVIDSIAYCCWHDQGRDLEALVAEAPPGSDWLERAAELVRQKLGR
jgi:hypothetical protein